METGLEKLFVGTWLNFPCFEPENILSKFLLKCMQFHPVGSCGRIIEAIELLSVRHLRKKASSDRDSSSVETSAFENPSRTQLNAPPRPRISDCRIACLVYFNYMPISRNIPMSSI
jgi:hypothetical protein